MKVQLISLNLLCPWSILLSFKYKVPASVVPFFFALDLDPRQGYPGVHGSS